MTGPIVVLSDPLSNAERVPDVSFAFLGATNQNIGVCVLSDEIRLALFEVEMPTKESHDTPSMSRSMPYSSIHFLVTLDPLQMMPVELRCQMT